MALAIERLAGELGARLDQLLVDARRERATVVLKDRPPRDLVVAGRVLGLAVPRERAVEAWEQLRVTTRQLIVHADQAHEAAHAALARGIDAVEAHQLRREIQPGGVRVEHEIEIRDRAPHAVLELAT